MPTQRRWMKWVIEEANSFDTVLPWERRANRTHWRRHLATVSLKKLLARA